MTRKNENRLKEILSEKQFDSVLYAVGEFWSYPENHAINALFAGAVENRYLESNLNSLGIDGFPKEAYPIIFRELRKAWEAEGSFLPELSEKTQAAFDELQRASERLYPEKDARVIAIQVYRRCLWYQKTNSVEVNLYEMLYELGFKKEEILVLKQFNGEIKKLMEAVKADYQEEMKAKEKRRKNNSPVFKAFEAATQKVGIDGAEKYAEGLPEETESPAEVEVVDDVNNIINESATSEESSDEQNEQTETSKELKDLEPVIEAFRAIKKFFWENYGVEL